VQPGQNVQAAIDSLPAAGGCICLKTGVHLVSEAVRIDRSRVVLHGESPGTIVRRRNGPLLLEIIGGNGTVEDVIVQGIDFQFMVGDADSSDPPLLANIDRTERCVVEDCRFSVNQSVFLHGIRIGASQELTIQRCLVRGVMMGIWVDTDSTQLTIRDNTLEGFEGEQMPAGLIGVFLEDAYGPSRIEGNRITQFLQGIVLNREGPDERPSSQASHSQIRRNRIIVEGPEGSGEEVRLFVIDVGAWNCTVQDNTLSYDSALFGGIRMAGPNGRVENNTLYCGMRVLPDGNPALGIQLGYSAEEPGVLGRHGVVSGNRLVGPQDGILLTGVTGGSVTGNLIEEGYDHPRNVIALNGCQGCLVSANRGSGFVHGIVLAGGQKNRILDNHLQTGGSGITASNETSLMVSRNRLDDVGHWGIMGVNLLGKASLHANRILNCGHTPLAPLGPIGIGVLAQTGELQIEACEVMDTGVSVDGETVVQPAFGIVALLVLECRVQGNLVTYTNLGIRDLEAEDRALRLQGLLEVQVSDNIVFGFCAQVLDNKFIGTGATALVDFLSHQTNDNTFIRFERVTFNNNYCFHFAQSEKEGGTVLLRGRSGIVMGNHIKSTASIQSVIFDGMRGIFLGNDTQFGANINFPSPESAFNH